mgnify:CR=1 FL=1
MRIAQQTIATLVVLTFIISPAMAVLKTVANPSNSQFGFEGVSCVSSSSSQQSFPKILDKIFGQNFTHIRNFGSAV